MGKIMPVHLFFRMLHFRNYRMFLDKIWYCGVYITSCRVKIILVRTEPL